MKSKKLKQFAVTMTNFGLGTRTFIAQVIATCKNEACRAVFSVYGDGGRNTIIDVKEM